MTDAEQDLVNRLGAIWNAYCELPVQHPWDAQEFMHTIHTAQRVILARAGVRAVHTQVEQEPKK